MGMKKILVLVLVLIVGGVLGGFYYYQEAKKPKAITSVQSATSYCENDAADRDIFVKNTVTSGELNKIDRVPRVTTDRCSTEGPELPGENLLIEVSCKNDIYVETKYTCGLGNICSDGRCVKR
jgi:hypothetical protein